MNRNRSGPRGPTRRRVLAHGSGAVAGGLLAGCISQSDPNSGGGSEAGADTGTGGIRGDGGATDAYEVAMEPVGTVTFEEVPRSIALFTADYADMLVALGHGDAVESVWYRERYKTNHYGALEGVSIDLSGLAQLWNDGVSKERFYEMDADLHLIDPHTLIDWFQVWDREDLEEIRTLAPFLGNVIFRRTDDWHDYRYYSLYEAFEIVAEVVRERDRFEAIRSIHDELVADVQSRLPAPDERPNAALVFGGMEPEQFYPYRLSGNGTNKEHFHALGISDAFAGAGVSGLSTSNDGAIDYETLLEIDPDSLLVRFHANRHDRFQAEVVEYMRDHEVGSELTAVQEGRVFQGGPIYAGPLHNLFMIERYARGYFPEEFTEDELFDRNRLARIVTEGVEQ